MQAMAAAGFDVTPVTATESRSLSHPAEHPPAQQPTGRVSVWREVMVNSTAASPAQYAAGLWDRGVATNPFVPLSSDRPAPLFSAEEVAAMRAEFIDRATAMAAARVDAADGRLYTPTVYFMTRAVN